MSDDKKQLKMEETQETTDEVVAAETNDADMEEQNNNNDNDQEMDDDDDQENNDVTNDVEEGDEDNVEDDDNNANTGNSGGGGGGKSNYRNNYNRRGGGKRFTPYPRNHRAVYHQSDDSDPSRRVYVGNLAWDVTWKELKDHMKKCECEIVRADILATPDGRSKGCGIVEFASEEGAKRALTLSDSELMGRQIFVREDRDNGSGGGYYTQQPGTGGGFAGGAPSHGGGGGSEKQDCRVYVGNLSWDVSWQDLKDHMRSAGEVLFADVMKESDGRSKGCGVVEFKSSDEAKAAIDTLNDTELKGRMIFVREDRETGGGGGGGGGRGGGGGGFQSRGGNSTSVYVGNLSYETSWQDLKDHMRKAGNVNQANILKTDDGRSKGCAIVIYQNPRDATRAIRELQNSVLHGRPIHVREDREQSGGRGSGGGGGHRSIAGGGGASSGNQLFVGNLSFDTNWKDLKDHFSQCGDVDRADVIQGSDGRKKGFGTVRFYNAKDAARAIDELNGVELDGRELEVRYDTKAGGRR